MGNMICQRGCRATAPFMLNALYLWLLARRLHKIRRIAVFALGAGVHGVAKGCVGGLHRDGYVVGVFMHLGQQVDLVFLAFNLLKGYFAVILNLHGAVELFATQGLQ